MMDLVQSATQHWVTPWIILAIAGMILATEAWRSSREALWGDIFSDEAED